MDNRFYRSHWDLPPSQSSGMRRGVPIQSVKASTNLKPKVVSIPVHFVGSEIQSRSDSALRIQKVFRGWLVRKSVNKIAQIRKEVNEIESKISNKETAEWVMKDAKERLRVTETLTNLLLRLDSVRGVTSGVRDCRKALIKKAIALQEKLDSVMAADQAPAKAVADEASDTENVECLPDLDVGGRAQENQSSIKPSDPDDDFIGNCDDAEQSGEAPSDNQVLERPKDFESLPSSVEVQPEGDRADKAVPSSETKSETVASSQNTEEVPTFSATDQLLQAEEDSVDREESVGTSRADCDAPNRNLVSAEDVNTNGVEPKPQHNDGAESVLSQRENRVLLEKMMEDSERMMGLMAELFEKNEMQTRMLSSLSRRVEQLEKAFICDMWRRKKRNATINDATTDGHENLCPNKKKYGKR